MKASTFAEALILAVESDDFDTDPDDEGDIGVIVRSVASFRDAGVMTRNEGMVVTLSDDTEFQVTVVRSSAADPDDEED